MVQFQHQDDRLRLIIFKRKLKDIIIIKWIFSFSFTFWDNLAIKIYWVFSFSFCPRGRLGSLRKNNLWSVRGFAINKYIFKLTFIDKFEKFKWTFVWILHLTPLKILYRKIQRIVRSYWSVFFSVVISEYDRSPMVNIYKQKKKKKKEKKEKIKLLTHTRRGSFTEFLIFDHFSLPLFFHRKVYAIK